MILYIDSDASYLSETKARSTVGGYLYLSNTTSSATPTLPNNGPIEVLAQILKEVVSSAAEAELGGLFYNGKLACPIRHALEEMGHPQPTTGTPIKTDNSTATGIANESIKQKRSKAMDMRYYWIRDRVRQNQFYIYWAPGQYNQADYFTKHHAPAHHRTMRNKYLYDPQARDYHGHHAIHCANTLPQFHVLPSGEGVLMHPYTQSQYTGNTCVYACDYSVTSHSQPWRGPALSHARPAPMHTCAHCHTCSIPLDNSCP
jgi:hypothetical protein